MLSQDDYYPVTPYDRASVWRWRPCLRRHHLRDPPDAGVARIQVVLLVHGPVAGLDELAVADAHAVPDGADDGTVAGHLQELPVLAARHPRIAFRVDVQFAHQISHLLRLQ